MIPIEPIDFWRYGELIALIPMLIGAIILVLYSRMKSGGYRSTISQTISQSFVTQRIFSPVMTLFFPLWISMVLGWPPR
jgi:preprotein translocase subunit SecG